MPSFLATAEISFSVAGEMVSIVNSIAYIQKLTNPKLTIAFAFRKTENYMKTYKRRGRTKEKPLNEWGKTFEAVLLEKQLTVAAVLKLLILSPAYVKLNRSTLHRWCHASGASLPPRAHAALEIIRQRPVINASGEAIQQWMEKLTRLDEQMGTMRTEVKILIAQLSFHKK